MIPKRPQKDNCLLFSLLLSLFWPFRTLVFRFLSPLKFCIWPMTCALLASRAPSAKMSVCITPAILLISYTICCFLCAFHAPSTFFYKTSSHFLKKCSPPSVGSMILKAAQKQNHETFAFGLLQLRQYAPFLPHASVAQHISKLAPFRYNSLQCMPS